MSKKYSYVTSKEFIKKWSKFNLKTKNEIVRKIDLFLQNPHSPTLKNHKLTERLNDYSSFSVSYHLRIIFRFIEEDIVEFIDIGEHEIYQ